jgi:hypothetical protein
MTPNINVEELLQAIDPLSEALHWENVRRRDSIWALIVAQQAPTSRPFRRPLLIGASSLATVGVVITLTLGLLPGTAPLGAAADSLHRAAVADASSATLPTLAADQYYYQKAQVAMDCTFASKSSPLIRYVSVGTIESWTSPNSTGQIVITPTPVSQGGSHFATSADEAAWISAGRPFVPCALSSPSNTLSGNPANANTEGNLGGYSATISGYSAFGVILGDAVAAAPVIEGGVPALILRGTGNDRLAEGTNVAQLPSDVTLLMSMLSSGEINPDGSASTSPQVCPINALPDQRVGCNTNQQLALIKELLQLPDASAKFGSVLYQVLAQMPGATVTTNVTDSFGNVGTSVSVPVVVGSTETGAFQVLIDPSTGGLLSNSDLLRAGYGIGTITTPFPSYASISYGPITVVQGVGMPPKATN